jgi:arylsulfatase A-like enzyme
MRSLFCFQILWCVLWLIASFGIVTAEEREHPNVVLFLADDQGWGDLSCQGNNQVKTPNIDSIGRDGARFENFFVCPVCSPTRAEMLTGRYYPRGGVRGVSKGDERLNLDEKTLADAFLAAGYATGAFGKWHNGSQWPYHPNARGFQEYYGFTSGHWGEYYDAPLERNGQPVRGKGFIADDLTREAIAFMEKHRDGPFFCYVPYNTPHSPFCVPDSYWERFKDKPIAQRGKDGDAEDVAVTRCTLAMVENLDDNVGRVLEALERMGLEENTIVIYFSDNGPNSFRWNNDMKGRKGSVDEGGVRVPFLIRWPAMIKPGLVIPEIAGAIDLLPTLTKMADVPRVGDKPLDGVDLSPLLFGKGEPWADRMIFSYLNGKTSVRTSRYRLDEKGALFDMKTDPGQRKDMAGQQPDVAERLRQAVATWREEVVGSAKGAKDDRPFPVGFREWPRTWLPARDGEPHGTVKRSSAAPNSSYFVNWTDPTDFITWDVAVENAGLYEVSVDYTCAKGDEGVVIECSLGESRMEGTIKEAWDPPLILDQDTILRPAMESHMKEFRSQVLGTMRLEKGRGLLTLRAKKIPGQKAIDLRSVTVTLKP